MIVAGIYENQACSLDHTVVLYHRSPLKRLGHINAGSNGSEYPHYLSGLAIGETLVATGWTVSNCTSTWNGKRIRIDQFKGELLTNILERGLLAQDRLGENVSPWVQGDVVTFFFHGAMLDSVGPSNARHRIVKDQAVRQAPIALTRVGFIQEWLDMDDIEAARWSEPGALNAHEAAAATIENKGFGWQHIARCGGASPVWEIAVKPRESELPYVFRIAGSRATKLRMLAITNKLTPGCSSIVINNSFAGVATELPW